MPREGKARVLTDADLKRLFKVIRADTHPERNAALLYMSVGLGLRVKEIAALSLGDVLDRREHLRDEISLLKTMTKGGKQRHVYLTNPKVRRALQDYLAVRLNPKRYMCAPGSALFLSNKRMRFTPNSLQQVFRRLYLAAGIEGASSHSGRRTFATRLIEKGVDIKAVSVLMGHSSVAMTARYVEDNPERLRVIVGDVL